MGIIIDPEERGDDCLACFEAGKTPKFMYAMFGGIGKGPAWMPMFPVGPAVTFKLTQSVDFPCCWYYMGDDWWVYYWAVAIDLPGVSSTIMMWYGGPGGFQMFFNRKFAHCQSEFTNEYTAPGWWVWYDGFCWVHHVSED